MTKAANVQDAPRGRRVPRMGMLVATWVTAVAACSQTPVYLPSHDFDRPTDLAFTCLDVGPSVMMPSMNVLGAQPMDVCHPPGTTDPSIGAPFTDGHTYKTYAFVANSGRGDVTVVDMSYCRSGDNNCLQRSWQAGAALVDLDPNSIGYATVPVGEQPEVIDASQDGCRLVTANRRSCDLTVIDPAALLKPRLLGNPLDPTYTRTFKVQTGSGVPLTVAPGEVAFVPQQTNVQGGGRAFEALCNDLGTLAAPVGDPPATSDARASWHVLVTFPSCDLIALVDLQTETILDSFQVSTTDGKSYVYNHTGTEPSCSRIDCGVGAGTFPDGGVPTPADGGAPENGALLDVQPLAIRPEGTRVYFGATNAPIIGALDLMGDTLVEPSQGASTPIANAGGVMRLRLSVDPYAYVNGHLPKSDPMAVDPNDPTKPELGRFVSQTDVTDRQYLYAIGRDASVRIVDVSRPDPTECDVGIDPSAVDPADPRQKCFPVDATDNPPRLPQIPYMAGLHFPSAPQDVAFGYYWTNPADPTATAVNEQILNGAFAFVLTGGGGVYLVNVDPAPPSTQQVYYADSNDTAVPKTPLAFIQPADPTQLFPQLTATEASARLVLAAGAQPALPLPLPNTPRNANAITYSQGLLTQVGPPRTDTTTPITTSNGPVLATFSATTTRENATIFPYVQSGVAIPPSLAVQTYVYFPNQATVQPQTWSITWEGDLTGVRSAGDIDEPRTDALDDPDGLAVALTDYGASFCSSGVFPGDTVTLTGCMVDGNCGPGRLCVHDPDAPPNSSGYSINGLCMPSASSTNSAILKTCAPLLSSFRRYEISPTLSSFTDSAQPQSTIVVVPKKSEIPLVTPCTPPSKTVPMPTCTPASRPDLSGFSCSDTGRCLMLCENRDTGAEQAGDCAQRRGSVCVDFRKTDGHFYCADGAPLRDAAGALEQCGLDQLIPYDVSAGKSFVVVGSAVGRADPGTSVELPLPGGMGGAAGAGGAAGGSGGSGGSSGSGLWQCARDTSASPTLVARIPLDVPHCSAPVLKTFVPGTDSNGRAALIPAQNEYKAVFTDSTLPSPSPCLIEFGPTTSGAGGAGGAVGSAGPTYSALFQNREIRFVLTNLETIVGDPIQIRFAVDGGTVSQTVPVAVDSAVGLPARIKLGPVPSVDQTLAPMIPSNGAVPSDLPHLFVVDQRTSATGRAATRGQILRIAPRLSDTSPVPSYQSTTDSNSYFPMQ